MKSAPTILLLILLFVASIEVHAQDLGLITDRPDFTESPGAVPLGTVQVEFGGTIETFNSVTLNTMGELLVRYGFLKNLELRIGAPSALSGDVDESGFGDASLGLKWGLGTVGAASEVGVIATLSLPTGADEFTSDGVDPSIILTSGTALTESLSLGSQIQGAYNSVGNDRRLDWNATVVLSFPFSGRAGGFAEIAAAVPEAGDAQFVFHAGATVALGKMAQFDIHGGFGLTDEAPDSFIGVGFSLRR